MINIEENWSVASIAAAERPGVVDLRGREGLAPSLTGGG
ncbi:hypothetical protein X759_09050 [Mesorhizobium sp. LSHC420B00]|nr:hypothetical protein X759_09050 [Mesorhizobium sp. LSHC420B00]